MAVYPDLYQTITDRVITLMETSGSNWANPFNKKVSSLASANAVTHAKYRGINTLLLAFTPYACPIWAGFQQWKSKGCSVRKGEKGTAIVYFKMLKRTEIKAGKKVDSVFPMLKTLHVFNAEQVDGDFAAALLTAPEALVDETEMCARADAAILATGVTLKYTANPRAYYSPSEDFVHLPERKLFSATATSSATEAYYGTALHELVHATGHTSRLARDFTGRFGTQAYAFEELIAELGSAFLSAELGISTEPRADHAQYLNNWLQVLKNDNRAFMKAASCAKAAAAFIVPPPAVIETVEEAA